MCLVELIPVELVAIFLLIYIEPDASFEYLSLLFLLSGLQSILRI